MIGGILMRPKFIKTSDLYTKEHLLKLGFQLISDLNGIYIFMNTPTVKFSKDEKDKFIYTNLLTF